MSAKDLPHSYGVAARLIVGAVLVYAGATKAAGPAEEFALVIGAYQVLPKDMLLSMAAFLPWVELLLGWALILGAERRAAAAGAGVLFGGFLLALLSVIARGIELPNCGCFGDGVHFTPPQALLFDLALVSLCFVSWKAGDSKLSLDSLTRPGYTPRR
jgi:uncharacterized membrane protein YphA (DoxX/SURF4 family)